MNRTSFLVACLLGSAIAIPLRAQGSLADVPLPPTDAEQKQIVNEIKSKAFAFEKSIPDFACLQLSHHSIDAQSRNQWKRLDTVSEQLRFVNHKAEYTMLQLNGKKAGPGDKRPSYLGSADQFVEIIHDIFDPKTKAEFAWTAWDSVRGHRVHMVTFGMKKENSTFTVGKKDMTAGMAGFIYADADTFAIMRIAVAATEVPVKYPIQGTSWDMNYDFVRFGDKIQYVPLKADFRSKDGKASFWDELELKDFKKP